MMPRYKVIYEDLVNTIRRDDIKPGTRLPSVNELIRQYNTTCVTVSRAIQCLVQQNYVQTKRGAGIFVKPREVPSRALSSASQTLIKALLPSPRELAPESGYYWFNYVEVLRGANEECERQDLILVHSYRDNPDRDLETWLTQVARDKKILGLIDPIACFRDAANMADILAAQNIRFAQSCWQSRALDSVWDSHRSALWEAMEYLVKKGRRRIAFASIDFPDASSDEKYETYCDFLTHHPLGLDKALIIRASDILVTAGERLLALRQQGINFDAVVAVNDHTAKNIMEAFAKAGVHIPKDVALIGSDDMPGVAQWKPPLATIRRVRFEIGRELVRMLADRVVYPDTPRRQIRLDNRFILRQSAG